MTRDTTNTEVLPREAWSAALDDLTNLHRGDGVTIEVLDRSLGDQVEVAEILPLSYIEYDHKDDVVVVAVGGSTARFPVVLRHFISHPQHIFVHPPPPALLESVAVIDEDGVETVVTMQPRPALPE